MASHILLVFEGAKTEKLIFNSLKNFYLNESTNTIVVSLYGSSIYSLYQIMKKDPDLDVFSLLKEKSKNKNKEKLDIISRDDVSEIYLFFDYDGHDPLATEEKLIEMLELFNEETKDGKLYLSYPMVESLKHLKTDVPFQNVVAESNKSYKQYVSKNCDPCFIHFNRLTKENWVVIINEHCKKLNYLVTGAFELPDKYIAQLVVFNSQIAKHITPYNKVAVLSSFPIFLADYYGYESLLGKSAAPLNLSSSSGSRRPTI